MIFRMVGGKFIIFKSLCGMFKFEHNLVFLWNQGVNNGFSETVFNFKDIVGVESILLIVVAKPKDN